MKALIVGGFEPSGHDAIASALLTEGEARGHQVIEFQWRDVIKSIALHPVFNLHRLGTSLGAPKLSKILDDRELWSAIVEDLIERIEYQSKELSFR